MADLSKDDLSRAVRDGLNDIKNDLSRIRDAVARVDERTNDLDRSQDEIRRVVDLVPRLETLTRSDKEDKILAEIAALKSAQAASVQYIQQVAKYLEAIDGRLRGDDGEKTQWRK